MQLILGNKNHSSWSMRAGLAARLYGDSGSRDEIQESVVPLFTDGYKERLREAGPTGLVPVLIDGETRVHDSLAIAFYLMNKNPALKFLPETSADRARALSIVCEMHSGFQNVRRYMPVDIRARHKLRVPETSADALQSELQRVFSIFGDELSRSGGPFLFGAYGLADIFYAPVVTRLRSFGIAPPAAREGLIQDYMAAVFDQPHVKAWCAEAETEAYSIDERILFGE